MSQSNLVYKNFNSNQMERALELLEENKNNPAVQKIVDYHNQYYQALRRDLENLLALVAKNLQNQDTSLARKLAIKNMVNDAQLMDEIKQYASQIDNFAENNAIIRLASNRTPFVLKKAAQTLADDQYFAAILAGQNPLNLNWQYPVFLSGVANSDHRGSSSVSALAASLIYLLDDQNLAENLYNYSTIIYNEAAEDILLENADLLAKVQKNYHLFSAKSGAIARVYEAYEFGGNKDFVPINNPQYLPLDCSTGIGVLLNIENYFSTNHLASYYNEFFQENSSYWRFDDWPIRAQMAQNLTPVKIADLSQIKAGTVISWRCLDNQKSLIDPRGYVGKSGHIGIVIGVKGDEIYYFSWSRNLEDDNKSGLGIDVLSIADTINKIADGKKALFTFEIK